MGCGRLLTPGMACQLLEQLQQVPLLQLHCRCPHDSWYPWIHVTHQPLTHTHTHTSDGTACVWDVESSNLLLKYVGHSGSVNSISFHPHEPLACTASGDAATHVWNCSVSIPRQRNSVGLEKMVCNTDMGVHVCMCGHPLPTIFVAVQWV